MSKIQINDNVAVIPVIIDNQNITNQVILEIRNTYKIVFAKKEDITIVPNTDLVIATNPSGFSSQLIGPTGNGIDTYLESKKIIYLDTINGIHYLSSYKDEVYRLIYITEKEPINDQYFYNIRSIPISKYPIHIQPDGVYHNNNGVIEFVRKF